MTFSRKKILENIKEKSKSEIEDNSKDKLGKYLKINDGFHAETRIKNNTNKALYIIAGSSLTINIILSVAIVQLIPLYKVVPFFVTFSDKAEQVVRIEPPTGDLRSLEILTESNIREYIIARNTISNDPEQTIKAWGTIVKSMSTKEVFDQFIVETKPVYNSLKEKKFTRSIVINSILRISENSYQVEFDAIDRRIGVGLTDTTEDRKTFIAQMKVLNIPKNVSYENRFINPLGFTVLEYSVAPKSR